MRKHIMAISLILLTTFNCQAAGFDWFFSHVRPTGKCSGQEIVATWYNFLGHTTANGEHFDANDLTAAHKTLPFGTKLTVTNPHNGRSVVVRINDRGPFVRGVSLDLTPGAAKAIGMNSSQYVCI
jgi:rare lipoprotein A (peptidoglycan hydrolase)